VSAFAISATLPFLLRDVGLVDRLTILTNLNRFYVILLMGRTVLWTGFLIFFFGGAVANDPNGKRVSSAGNNYLKVAKQHTTVTILTFLMMLLVSNVLPQLSQREEESLMEPGEDYYNSTTMDPLRNTTLVHVTTAGKMTVLGINALCEYIAVVISLTIFHRRPGVATMMKQARVQFLPILVAWTWFGSILFTALTYNDPDVSQALKVIMLGWVYPFIKVIVVYMAKIAAVNQSKGMNLDDKESVHIIMGWIAASGL
jgi:hypothetical protein